MEQQADTPPPPEAPKTHPRPRGRFVGKKLRMLEISVMSESFGIDPDDCEQFLHRIGVPTLAMGGSLWYEEGALEQVLASLSRAGGRGIGMNSSLGVTVADDPETGGVRLKAKSNWVFKGSRITGLEHEE